MGETQKLLLVSLGIGLLVSILVFLSLFYVVGGGLGLNLIAFSACLVAFKISALLLGKFYGDHQDE